MVVMLWIEQDTCRKGGGVEREGGGVRERAVVW